MTHTIALWRNVDETDGSSEIVTQRSVAYFTYRFDSCATLLLFVHRRRGNKSNLKNADTTKNLCANAVDVTLRRCVSFCRCLIDVRFHCAGSQGSEQRQPAFSSVVVPLLSLPRRQRQRERGPAAPVRVAPALAEASAQRCPARKEIADQRRVTQQRAADALFVLLPLRHDRVENRKKSGHVYICRRPVPPPRVPRGDLLLRTATDNKLRVEPWG